LKKNVKSFIYSLSKVVLNLYGFLLQRGYFEELFLLIQRMSMAIQVLNQIWSLS